METNDCIDKKKIEFSDKIYDIVDDTLNKKQKLIILSKGLKISTYYTNNIWNNLEIGDSIIKSSNTYKFKVKRNNKTFILDFSVDCE
jgi:hypothetical protein